MLKSATKEINDHLVMGMEMNHEFRLEEVLDISVGTRSS